MRYRFEFGRPEGPSTWATGETSMLQRTGLADSLIRVEGSLRTWDDEPAPFVYSTDGRSTWAIDPVARSVRVRKVGDGDRSLGGQAVYGYLPELVERLPYWKEMEQAESLRLLEPASVGEESCYVLEVRYHAETPQETRHLWYLAEKDLLPRGLRWFDRNTPEGGEFWIYDLRIEDLRPAAFAVEIPAGFESLDTSSSTARSPDPAPPAWSLTSWRGETVTTASLRGKVVVLDFWNTWCFICRALQPQMGKLAAWYAEDGERANPAVAFFGVNVFEIDGASPDDHWAQTGHEYNYLQEGDAVALLYDVPWQPGVVVLGQDGRVLFSLVGGTGDRMQQIERAIEDGLRSVPPTGG